MTIKNRVLSELLEKNKKEQGLAKIAALKLEAFCDDYDEIYRRLKEARSILKGKLGLNALDYDENRDTYELFGLNLYVDFLFDCQNQDDDFEVCGNIVFGVTRYTHNYKKVHRGNDDNSESTEKMKDNIEPKEKMEDKSILKFILNEHGHITAEDSYKDKIWHCGNDSDISELCVLALKEILADAFLWKNEILIP